MNKKLEIRTPKDLEELGYYYDTLYQLLTSIITIKNEETLNNTILEVITSVYYIIKKELKGVTNQSSVLKRIWKGEKNLPSYADIVNKKEYKTIVFGSIYYIIQCEGSNILKNRCTKCIKNLCTRAENNRKAFDPFKKAADTESGTIPSKYRVVLFKAILDDYVKDGETTIRDISFIHEMTGINKNYIKKISDPYKWGEHEKEYLGKWVDKFPKLENTIKFIETPLRQKNPQNEKKK